jgi:hypothetical protein
MLFPLALISKESGLNLSVCLLPSGVCALVSIRSRDLQVY